MRQTGGDGRRNASVHVYERRRSIHLYNAVVTAADKASANRGVLVVMNDTVLDGRDVTKTNTTDVATFKSVNYGPLGYIHNGKIDYQRTPARKHTSDTPFDVSKLNELPKVGIVYNYANASDLPAKALVDAGYDGIVSAGVGNGNLYKSVFDTLATAAKTGTAVVRSSAYRRALPLRMPKWMMRNTASSPLAR